MQTHKVLSMKLNGYIQRCMWTEKCQYDHENTKCVGAVVLSKS